MTYELLNAESEVSTIPPDVAQTWNELIDAANVWEGNVATVLGRHADGNIAVQIGVVQLTDGGFVCWWQDLANFREPVFAEAVPA